MIKVLNKNKHDCSCGEYIGRGSVLGNPFDWMGSKHPMVKYQVKDRETAIENYSRYLRERLENKDPEICAAMNKLWKIWWKEGKLNLMCFCSPLDCHGRIIKEILEETNESRR